MKPVACGEPAVDSLLGFWLMSWMGVHKPCRLKLNCRKLLRVRSSIQDASAARKVGPGSPRLGIRLLGRLRSIAVVKYLTDTTNGVNKRHGATHRRQVAPVPERYQAPGEKHEAIRLGKSREHSQCYVRRLFGTHRKFYLGRGRAWARRARTRRRRNDQAWASDCETEKALETLAIQCARLGKVSEGLGEINIHFDKEFLEMQDALERAREAQRFAEIAAQMVHDGRVKVLGDAVTATRALPCGKNDRDSNELKCLQDASDLVDDMHGKKSYDDYEFVTAEEPPSPYERATSGVRGGGGEDEGSRESERGGMDVGAHSAGGEDEG